MAGAPENIEFEKEPSSRHEMGAALNSQHGNNDCQANLPSNLATKVLKVIASPLQSLIFARPPSWLSVMLLVPLRLSTSRLVI